MATYRRRNTKGQILIKGIGANREEGNLHVVSRVNGIISTT
jgi:hypothetical protein